MPREPWDVLRHLDCEREPSVTIIFSAACALYWYANDYHEGQNSPLYSILSTSEYRPGANETGPEFESTDDDIYKMLECKTLEPQALADWIASEWPKAKAREEGI